ncbi:15163_t:CDS:2, partial [Cetraspora pellucida]
GEKGDIRDLTKSARIKKLCTDFVVRRNELSQFHKLVLSQLEIITHNQWIEEEYGKERAVRDIIDVLLQEIKLNALRKVSHSSENSLVEIIAKNCKVQQQKGSRGNKLDLMIRMFVHKKWEEIVYLKSGKWNCNDEKIHDDHNKLVQFCLDGTEELFKICKKESLNKNYIGFGINIAGKYIEIHGLIHENGIKYYLPILQTKIPFEDESVDEVEEFVHALLILREIVEDRKAELERVISRNSKLIFGKNPVISQFDRRRQEIKQSCSPLPSHEETISSLS